VETRRCLVINDLSLIEQAGEWEGLQCLVKVESTRYFKCSGKEETDTRLYITSLKADAKLINNAVHTWGDGGVLEYRMEYVEGLTRVTNSPGHTEEYYYDQNRLIYKIIDGNGGTTRWEYSEYQELIAEVNLEGHIVKMEYNEYGRIVRRIDANGESTRYAYDAHRFVRFPTTVYHLERLSYYRQGH
jgi:YD repeat-containing protein